LVLDLLLKQLPRGWLTQHHSKLPLLVMALLLLLLVTAVPQLLLLLLLLPLVMRLAAAGCL
jgi:hypothetical protein